MTQEQSGLGPDFVYVATEPNEWMDVMISSFNDDPALQDD